MLVSINDVSLKVNLLSVTFTQKWLRSVCSLWPTLRRPLHCNHHGCDMSSCLYPISRFCDSWTL